MAVDKRALVAALRAQLQAEIDAMARLARDAAEAATHEENKPENDKDMRSTEASYLARGQAERVRELEAANARLGGMELRAFGEGDSIGVGAVVTLRSRGATSRCFVVPSAGGQKVSLADGVVLAVTPSSPLGAAIVGLSLGEEAEAPTPQGARVYEILGVE